MTKLDAARLSQRCDAIRARREALERRLEDGYERIEQALDDGADVAAWEDFWLQLLRDYEVVCDELSLAA
jgi:hypothetical protein